MKLLEKRALSQDLLKDKFKASLDKVMGELSAISEK